MRTLHERADILETKGVMVGDFMNYGSLVATLDGVSFRHPVGAGIAEAAGPFVNAGRKRDLATTDGIDYAAIHDHSAAFGHAPIIDRNFRAPAPS